MTLIHHHAIRGDAMTDAFISYAREDSAFVQSLDDRLNQEGLKAWVDWEDIPYSVDWWQEIQSGIDQSNTFIFVITPDSLASRVCNLEVEHAFKRNKRIIPIMRRKIDEKAMAGEWFEQAWEDIARENWKRLKKINWIDFTVQAHFETSFTDLLDTLTADPEHIRAHTRLLVRAQEWQTNGRKPGYALRGADLEAAETWLAASANLSPPPTELHTTYILASRALTQGQTRRLLAAGLFAVLVLVVLAVLLSISLADSQYNLGLAESRGTAAAQQAATAEDRRLEAQYNEATAIVAQHEAERNLHEAWNTQALFLANLSRQELEAHHPQPALALALESLAHLPDGIYNPENHQALLNILNYPVQEVAYFAHTIQEDVPYRVTQIKAMWNADETQILSFSLDGTVYVWDAISNEAILQLPLAPYIYGATWNADETRILAWSRDGTIRVWDATNGDVLLDLAFFETTTEENRTRTPGILSIVTWNRDGTQIFAWSRQVLKTWHATTGEEILSLHRESNASIVAWSNDETQILGYAGNTAYLWDAANGETLQALRHERQVIGATWNTDETQVLSWSQDGSIKVWDADNGDELVSQTFSGLQYPIGAVWNTSETAILGWTNAGEIRVWDASTGEEILSLNHAYGSRILLTGAAWSNDGSMIISWAKDSTISFWDAISGKDLTVITHNIPGEHLQGVRQSNDGSQLLTASETAIVVWDMATQQELFTVAHQDHIYGATWNNDGTRILSWAADGTVRVWDTTGNAAHHILLDISIFDDAYIVVEAPAHSTSNSTASPVWNAEENRIARGLSDGTVQVWNATNGSVQFVQDHGGWVNGVAWNPASSQILSWGDDGAVRGWDASDGEQLFDFYHDDTVRGALWNNAGTQVLSWSDDNTVRVWSLASETAELVLNHSSRIFGASWNRRGTRILSWTTDGGVTVWDAASGDALASISHEGWVYEALWNTDATKILSCSDDGVIKLWDAASGEEYQSFSHDDWVTGIRWNSDETQILSWSADGTARVWFLTDEAVPLILEHGDEVLDATWNMDETQILTWSYDGSARVWAAESGEELLRLESGGQVTHAAWNAAETQILTASSNHSIHVWDAISGEMLFMLSHGTSAQGAAWLVNETHIFAWSANRMTVWVVDINELIEIGQSLVIRELSNEERKRAFLPTLEPIGNN
jgi:WD40 repeat protein